MMENSLLFLIALALISPCFCAGQQGCVGCNRVYGFYYRNFTILADGTCCDNPTQAGNTLCINDMCDIAFKVCATRDGGELCKAFYTDRTDVTSDKNNFVMTGSKFGDNNKTDTLQPFKTKLLPGDIFFSISALEMTGYDSQLIANFTFVIDWLDPIYADPPHSKQLRLTTKVAEIGIDVFSMCTKHYFGSECEVHCKPEKDRYNCFSNGTKNCTEGWKGIDCDIEACKDGRCQNGGSCIEMPNGYNCSCLLSKYHGSCPSGWTLSSSSGTCIKFVDVEKTWQDARTACQQEGADLVKITDDSTNQLIADYVSKHAPNTPYWNGLHDQTVDGLFVWLDETREATWTKWAQHQPNSLSAGQDCVEIGLVSPNEWNDIGCSLTARYICGKSLGSTDSTGKNCEKKIMPPTSTRPPPTMIPTTAASTIFTTAVTKDTTTETPLSTTISPPPAKATKTQSRTTTSSEPASTTASSLSTSIAALTTSDAKTITATNTPLPAKVITQTTSEPTSVRTGQATWKHYIFGVNLNSTNVTVLRMNNSDELSHKDSITPSFSNDQLGIMLRSLGASLLLLTLGATVFYCLYIKHKRVKSKKIEPYSMPSTEKISYE